MTMYKHQTTGALVELLERGHLGMRVKGADTGETKTIGFATFKRWWKLVEETTVEEPTDDKNAPELDLVDETTIDETDSDMDNQSAPEDEGPCMEDIDGTEDEVAPEASLLTMSEIVTKLENLFDILNAAYFEGKLPRPVITVQSTPKAYGHCSNKKIWSSGIEGEGDAYYEINLGAEFLNRPSEQTAATLLHEMVHLHCRENGIKETCQGVRYHTKVFKTEAEARDLEIGYDRAIGYSLTTPAEALIEKLKGADFIMEIPFARHTLGDGKSKAVQRNKSHKYECSECGQSVRSAAELNINCGICEVRMERAA